MTEELTPPDSLLESDRYKHGTQTDWRDLIDNTCSINANMTLGEVQEYFRANPDLKFTVVLDEHKKLIGLCSEQKISRILSHWGLGYAVFARKSVANHLLESDTRVTEASPVQPVLDRIMARPSEEFFDDAILTDPDGNYLGLISTQSFMHLQHRINTLQLKELQQVSDQLHHSNEELTHARDIAMQAAQMKSSFLANMSHEIRTPMNGILGMLRILGTTPLDEKQKRYADIAKNSADALLTILNDILDFSKIEAGKLDVEKVSFDLNKLIEEVLELHSERAHQKGIELFNWIEKETPYRLFSDPTRIRQVLLNLLSNAIKFTESGEVFVRLETESETDKTLSLKLSITDSGIGIDTANQEKLFDAFEQEEASTNRRYGGTGLGLAICKRIIELLGGEIGVTSERGKGSTFWFRLTLEKDTAALASLPPTPAPESYDFWGLRVLVVDHSSAFTSYLKHHLDDWKAATLTASSGENALTIAHQYANRNMPFDLILSDYKLPDTDGISLAKNILSLNTSGNMKVILLTDQDLLLDSASDQEKESIQILAKPITPSRLGTSIQSATIHRNLKAPALPPDPEHQLKSPEPSTSQDPLEQTEAPSDQLRLLLVEDSEVNREVASILLSSWNHVVETAENGMKAIEKLQSSHYDCVLMDCQMPEMDGYEATRAIRCGDAGERQKDIFIIAMTAHALQGDREKCIETGMNDYVSKPIDETQLQQAIENSRLHSPEHKTLSSPPPEITSPPETSESFTLDSEEKDDDDDIFFPEHLIQMFLTETRNKISELETALLEQNQTLVTQIAHTIKGTSGNFRAFEVYEVAKEIENAASQNNLDHVSHLFPSLNNAFRIVSYELANKQDANEADLTP